MNLSNIEPGMRIKNYGVLCEILGEPEKKGGTSKIAQLKRWARYFSWERSGNAYIIKEVFETPNPKPFRADDELAADFLAILHDHFNGKGTETFFVSDLLILFGIVNGREKQKRQLGETFMMDHFGINDYDHQLILDNYDYHVSHQLRNLMFSNLSKLKTREYLDYERTLLITPINSEQRLATPKEEAEFDQLAKCAKEKLGIQIDKQVPNRLKAAFYRELNKLIHLHGWNHAFPCVTINYNPKYRVDDESFDVALSRKKINNKAVSMMTGYIDTDISRDVKSSMRYFEGMDEEDAEILDLFYPLPIDKYLIIKSTSLEDLKSRRKELIDSYIRLP